MENYIVSYITKAGLIVLDSVIVAKSRQRMIKEIKGKDSIIILLSCIIIG